MSMSDLAAFYRGKRVLVTGHTGFKGAWLTLWLEHMGAKVIGYSLDPPSDPYLFGVLGLDAGISHNLADIRDMGRLSAVFAEHAPEVVIHMAAQPLVRLSYAEPRLTYETNVMGTVNVLEAVRATPSVRVAVNVTSDKCYENREWVWGYRENDPMGGHDPYSSSKGCAELAAGAWLRSFFPPSEHGRSHHVALASVRAGNVIGGGDWGLDRLLPDCMRAFAKGEEVVIRNPGATRPWQHVLEPLSGYLTLAMRLAGDPSLAGGWNFGPTDEDVATVADVVGRVAELWDGGKWRVDDSPQVHEARLLKLDCSKARFDLGWNARWGLAAALEETTAWYRRFYSGDTDMKAFTQDQIERHAAS